ncbi:uncharacterized protein [Nicotiana sylvestris]|uniref:uncharacterized protein n=1 Tax=Nicotiana sylvestris TaxID=4096 RepID=UPI00388CDA61
MADYEIIDQLQKSPAQVSLLSLLMNSTEHQKVLIKTLNKAHVPVETTVEQLERIAERFFAINQISFSKNDFPPEGAAHNKALHLIVKCEGYYVKRVMLDGGSGVDICPLSTLQRMKIGTERIRPNNVCMHAFDGIKRDTIGEIDLILTIGPMDFEVTFQVLDMDTFYNFLLGRPWIHASWVVPSTLHQMVKFKHEDQEIVVHGEDEQSIYRDPLVPCLETREGSEHIVYQAFEIVVADQCEEGNPCPKPFLSNASIMVAKEMIRHGYEPGKGLGKSLQGIAEPITLTASEKFFGVDFQPTSSDGKWAGKRKNNGWVLPQPIPHLYRTFVEPKYNEEEEDEDFTAEEIEKICGAMRQMLYEVHMVQPGKGSSTAENLNDTELVNLGSSEEVRETKISIHADEKTRDTLVQLLFEFKDVFAWSYDDIPRLSVDLVGHKLPTYPDYPPIQQKKRKFKADISDKIKEEVTKLLKAGVIRVVRYTTWLANAVPVPKKDGKTRVCMDYRDLNKASPKDNSLCQTSTSLLIAALNMRYSPSWIATQDITRC